MTQIVPASAQLRRRWAGQVIGYEVLSLDRSLFRAWTNDQVQEPAPAYFVATNGVEAPDAGGYIVWGLVDQPVVESVIEPASASFEPALSAGLDSLYDELIDRIKALFPQPAPVIVDTNVFEAGVMQLRSELAAIAEQDDQRLRQRLTEIHARLNGLSESLRRHGEAYIVAHAAGLDVTTAKFNQLFLTMRQLGETEATQLSEAQQAQRAGLNALSEALMELRSVSDQTHDLIATDQLTRRKQRQSLALIEEYIEQHGEIVG